MAMAPLFLIFILASIVRLALSLPAHAAPATIIERQDDLLDVYDFVVVGGGTAGLTVADRLTESGDYTVLVIEYGYLDNSDSILAVQVPDRRNAGPDQYSEATRWYNISTVPQTALNGRSEGIRAGAAVGGSSTINGMLFDRGAAEDYDAWVSAAGEFSDDFASDWGWDNILPAFKKSVTFHPPTDEMQEDYGITFDVDAAYGGTAPIHSSYRPYQWPAQQIMFEALAQIPGIASPREAADGSKYGVVWMPNSMTADTHQRSYAKSGHYDDGPGSRANYHILPAHRVIEVVMAPSDTQDDVYESQAVRFVPRDGRTRPVSTVSVSKEVVVSAGTMHTPQVLERSGIGSPDVLEAADVPVKVDLPGVGWNFQSHTAFSVGFRFGVSVRPSSSDLSNNQTFIREAQRQWDGDRTGPYTARGNSGVFLPFPVFSNETEAIISRIEAQDPDEYLPAGLHPSLVAGYAVQRDILIQQLRSNESAWLESLFSGGASLQGILLHIFSRGTVHISPDDDGIDTPPEIDYRSCTNPIDMDLNVELYKGIRWFMGHDAMVDALDPVETSPRLTSDGEIRSWLRRTLNANVAHQTGTSTLGPRELGGVVGPDLRVYGTRKLSIADNSIMPLVPGSHTSATAYAIGEKAAELILRRA